MYEVIKPEQLKNKEQYDWFRTFSNPCYGFNVKMDVSEVVAYSKRTGTSFFINVLYLITTGLSSIEEMRMRKVDGEIRLYHKINPTFTVMTTSGVYENAGFEMIDEYPGFYQKAAQVLQQVKNQEQAKETYNDNAQLNDYYMTCLSWLSVEAMSHPLCNNNHGSSSCPRICWDRYREENGRLVMLLNITVSHCFVDGYPLSCAFRNIQENFNRIEEIVNGR